MGFELSGMDELISNLRKVGQNVEKAKEKALTKGAEVIRKSMSQKAPRGIKNPNSIYYKAGKKYAVEHLKDNIIVSEMKGNRNDEYVDVGPEKHFFYAKFLEFGTEKMRAQPFAEPAFLEKRNEALDVIANEIKNAIEGAI